MIKRAVKTGRITIGGGSPVSVQSMTNTDTADTEATTAQLKALEKAGCDIARLAVRDFKDVEACRTYIENFDMPLVADIQFDYRLAVACADIGFSKVRFNPGNTSAAGVRELAAACKANGCPIRIGINGGSLEKDIKAKYGGVTAHGLAESAIRTVRSLERESFSDIVISVKASDVRLTVDAYTELDKLCGYPLHIGITESGAGTDAIIKSAAGIGGLLLAGIGDTIRVSLTGDPVREVITGKSILRAVGLDKNYVEVVSCPTCARCFYDLDKQAAQNCRHGLRRERPGRGGGRRRRHSGRARQSGAFPQGKGDTHSSRSRSRGRVHANGGRTGAWMSSTQNS